MVVSDVAQILMYCMPFLALCLISRHYGRAQSRQLKTIDALIDNIVALKNPWVAQQVQQMRAAQEASRMRGHEIDDGQPDELEELV